VKFDLAPEEFKLQLVSLSHVWSGIMWAMVALNFLLLFRFACWQPHARNEGKPAISNKFPPSAQTIESLVSSLNMATSAIVPILIGLTILVVLRRRQRNSSDDVHRLPSPVHILCALTESLFPLLVLLSPLRRENLPPPAIILLLLFYSFPNATSCDCDPTATRAMLNCPPASAICLYCACGFLVPSLPVFNIILDK
jgi:hypothetical protein